MSPEVVTAWITVGAQLVTVLGVPIASVVRMFRDNGGSEQDAERLALLWGSLVKSVEDRVAALKRTGAEG